MKTQIPYLKATKNFSIANKYGVYGQKQLRAWIYTTFANGIKSDSNSGPRF